MLRILRFKISRFILSLSLYCLTLYVFYFVLFSFSVFKILVIEFCYCLIDSIEVIFFSLYHFINLKIFLLYSYKDLIGHFLSLH